MATMRKSEVMSDKCNALFCHAFSLAQAGRTGCSYAQVAGTVLHTRSCSAILSVNIFRITQLIYLLNSVLIDFFIYNVSFTMLYRQNLAATFKNGPKYSPKIPVLKLPQSVFLRQGY
jgi:hypothetical protein